MAFPLVYQHGDPTVEMLTQLMATLLVERARVDRVTAIDIESMRRATHLMVHAVDCNRYRLSYLILLSSANAAMKKLEDQEATSYAGTLPSLDRDRVWHHHEPALITAAKAFEPGVLRLWQADLQSTTAFLTESLHRLQCTENPAVSVVPMLEWLEAVCSMMTDDLHLVAYGLWSNEHPRRTLGAWYYHFSTADYTSLAIRS